jgi:hypothetical protein
MARVVAVNFIQKFMESRHAPQRSACFAMRAVTSSGVTPLAKSAHCSMV